MNNKVTTKDGFGVAAGTRLDDFMQDPNVQEIVKLWQKHGYSPEATKQYLAGIYVGQSNEGRQEGQNEPLEPQVVG